MSARHIASRLVVTPRSCVWVVVVFATMASSCGGPAGPGGEIVRPAATDAGAATAVPTPSRAPTPTPSPIVSAKGGIVVREPASGTKLVGKFVISGEASVFEGNVQWRVVDAGGAVLGHGFTTATAGAPLRGTFRAEASFSAPYYDEIGFVEVFEKSAKDDTITEIVRVPVTLAGSY